MELSVDSGRIEHKNGLPGGALTPSLPEGLTTDWIGVEVADPSLPHSRAPEVGAA